MKAAKLLGMVERKAGAQATRLLRSARKGYARLARPSAKLFDAARQRRYIQEVGKTLASAEKIIAQLKVRVAAAEKFLAARKKRPAKRTKRRTRRPVKPAVTRARRKKRG